MYLLITERRWHSSKNDKSAGVYRIFSKKLYVIKLMVWLCAGQRKYGGPPPGWEGNTPGAGCEVFCGKIPKDMYEDELIPLFENCGAIWDLRLMMDPMTGTNRGYAFVTFTTRDAAQNAVREVTYYTLYPDSSSCTHNIHLVQRYKAVLCLPTMKLVLDLFFSKH